MLTRSFATRVAMAILAVGVAVEAQSPAKPKLESIKPKMQCSAMVGFAIPAARIALPTKGATINTAEIKGPTGQPGAPDYQPEYCSMRGVIMPVDPNAPLINFGVAIPTMWNQKAWHIAGQGFNGIIPVYLEAVTRAGQPDFRAGSPLNATYPPNAPQPLGQGYATFGGDSGHQNPPPLPPGQKPDPAAQAAANAWMWNEEAWFNLRHAGLKKTRDASQEVIKAMYGTTSRVTYFGGQSHGGREALFIGSLYGADYDGVLAAGPLVYWTGWITEAAMRVKRQTEPGAWVPPSKAAAIRDETLRLCDSLDGLADSVIQNYVGCNRKLDPTITPNPLANILCPGGADAGDHCLSAKQMETVNSWHAPIKYPYALSNGETDWPGEPTGGEGTGGWLLNQQQPTSTTPTGFIQFARGGLRDKDWNGATIDFEKEKAKILKSSAEIDAKADFSKLLGHGGKWIYYSPGSDYLISARAQARFYEEVAKKAGPKVAGALIRYYVGPGLGHGGGGNDAKGRPLPQFADLVSALENWVENGVAPEALVQTSMEPKPPFTVTRSRPLCRYPQYPHYTGSGNPDVAASYTCRAPEQQTSSK